MNVKDTTEEFQKIYTNYQKNKKRKKKNGGIARTPSRDWENNFWVNEITDAKRHRHLVRTLTYIDQNRYKYLKYAKYCFVPATLLGGIFGTSTLALEGEYKATINPIRLMAYGLTGGFGYTFFVFIVMWGLLTAWRTKKNLQKELLDGRGINLSETATKGSAHFMDNTEKRKVLLENDQNKLSGSILGRDMDTEQAIEVNPHMKGGAQLNSFIAVIGTPGTGKTFSFGVPYILQCLKRGESCIITDPKGELYGLTSRLGEKYGYDIRAINLISMLNSDGCNFLKVVGKDTIMAQKMAHSLIMNATSSTEQSKDYFVIGGEALIAFAILYVVLTDEYQEKTLGNVFDFLSKPSYKEEYDKNGEKIVVKITALEKMTIKAANLKDGHAAREQWNIFLTTPLNAIGSIHSTVTTSLQLLNNPAINAITSHDDIDFELPGKKKCLYYLILPDGNTTFDFISSLFYELLFDKLKSVADNQYNEKLPVPVNMMLDEFPNTCKISNFEKQINVVRSRGIKIALLAQNLGQLMDRYPGHEWESIISACDTQILLGLNEIDTNGTWWSTKTGPITAVTKAGNAENENGMRSSETDRYLLTADEIQAMDKMHQLVFLNGYHVIKTEKIGYPEYDMAKEIEKVSAYDHKASWWDEYINEPWYKDMQIEWEEKKEQRIRSKKQEEMKKKNGFLEDVFADDKNFYETESPVNEFFENTLLGQIIKYLVKKYGISKEKERIHHESTFKSKAQEHELIKEYKNTDQFIPDFGVSDSDLMKADLLQDRNENNSNKEVEKSNKNDLLDGIKNETEVQNEWEDEDRYEGFIPEEEISLSEDDFFDNGKSYKRMNRL